MSDHHESAKNSHYQGVTYGIPTFGKISTTFMLSQIGMGMPIFCNVGFHVIQGKPVDVARNEIAYMSLKNQQAYVFFRDDDTIAPRDALIKMMKRLPIKTRTDPYNEAEMVVGGVVYSKAEPPVPMIFREGGTGGLEDWEVGDLVECDVIGMGCTLIPTGVFKKALEHVKHWVCVNEYCKTNWSVDRDSNEKCPDCGKEVVPGLFKTVRDVDPDTGNQSTMTEDAYFLLNKCKPAGVKVYADCGVQCKHEVFDPKPDQTKYYYYNEGLRTPCWQMGSKVFFWPDIDLHKQLIEKADNEREKLDGPVKFNLGCGGERLEGYINSDLYTESDFNCDARNILPLISKYGKADEIRASHVLEHIPRDLVLGTLRSWIRALKPGGILDVETPDTLWACENFIKSAQNGNFEAMPEAILYGLQAGEGDAHMSAIYERKLKAMVESCDGLIESFEINTLQPEDYNQQVLRLRVVKKKEEVPVGAEDNTSEG